MTMVLHMMRTYGVHGGERQLSQLFKAQAPGDIQESFCLIFRDTACRSLFKSIKRLSVWTLCNLPLKPKQNPWLELLLVILLLPFLQIKLFRYLRRHRPRICVVHGFQAALVVWLPAMFYPDMKCVYVHRTTKSKRGRIGLIKLLYRPYTYLVGVSRAAADSLQGLIAKERIRVIRNAIDYRAFEAQLVRCPQGKSQLPTVIAVGRLLPSKDWPNILRAFSVIHQQRRARLWVVGQGPLLSELQKLAQTLGCAADVEFLGRREDIPCLLKQAHVFVHAAFAEGLSNAVLEAMAAGLPSVVVDAPGVTECHQTGESGFVVPRDPLDMADKLHRLLEDPTFAERLGEGARQRVQNQFDVANNRAAYTELYSELTGV